MYQKVSTDMNFAQREEEVIKFWRDEDVFKKTVKLREGAPAFTFFDGPPTANGKPHIGHVETRAIKDIIPRYRTMKGYDVLRKAGWDTHGLPVELEVEKMLGLDGKPQIEEYGIEPFIKKCKESVWKYKTEWEQMSERVGYWADMEHPYITYEDNYIESEWWSLKKIYEKGLLYKGHKIVPYCPRCGTALSSHEVAQGYKRVEETSAVVRFKVKGTENTYLTAWTTTPWTLPSNVALCVNPDEDYVKLTFEGDTYYMAGALVESIFGGKEEKPVIVETMKGSALEYIEYEPLYEVEREGAKFHYVVCDSYVTMSDGTGIVHIAPAFGEDDARVGRKYNLPFVQLVDAQGCLTDETKWPGVFVKDADKLVLADLKERRLLVKAPKFEHDYPFCWRCDTPLIYYARQSWFIKMTAVHDELMRNNRAVNWMPDNIKEGRMGNFLDNVIDWGLSRERYWGTPLPVWTCKCGHVHVIGSREELLKLGHNVDPDIELHRPYIDNVVLTCPKCGGDMHREKEVIDCWYDSGSMPFAQWHYPFENKEQFERRFPADFISEAIDQTRGWVYTLLAISTCMFDTNPFKNCIVMGHVQDKDGKKMSKHIGNTVDPWSVLNTQGADAVRWFFYNNAAPWMPNRFHAKAIDETTRKYMGTLWNTYAFFILYAEIDQFNPKEHPLDKAELTLMDRWILSRMIVSGATLPQDFCALAEDELNVKDAVFTDDTTAFMTYQLKPQMRTLGKKYGKLLKAIGEKLATLDGNAVVAGFEKGEMLRFELDGTMIELEKDDVLTAPMKKPGYVVATDRGVTVALDTNLTEALIAEGFAREVISKLQTMRKEAGFEVVDRIHVTVKTADEKLAQIVEANADAIERGVLALDVTLGDAPEGAYVRDWSINGVDATLSVAKA